MVEGGKTIRFRRNAEEAATTNFVRPSLQDIHADDPGTTPYAKQSEPYALIEIAPEAGAPTAVAEADKRSRQPDGDGPPSLSEADKLGQQNGPSLSAVPELEVFVRAEREAFEKSAPIEAFVESFPIDPKLRAANAFALRPRPVTSPIGVPVGRLPRGSTPPPLVAAHVDPELGVATMVARKEPAPAESASIEIDLDLAEEIVDEERAEALSMAAAVTRKQPLPPPPEIGLETIIQIEPLFPLAPHPQKRQVPMALVIGLLAVAFLLGLGIPFLVI